MPDPPRILVVDDDADTLLLLEEILTKEGYQVRTAEHAEAALNLVLGEEPDVVVTDIQMPGMDGLALLAELQRRLPQTLVVLATAFGSLKTAVDGIKAGAFDYLGKPFVVMTSVWSCGARLNTSGSSKKTRRCANNSRNATGSTISWAVRSG
jgi:DNA-binding NtrC family response regulator